MGQSLRELRLDLAVRSKWNIGFFWAGLVFWLYAAIVGWLQPLQVARIYWLIGTTLIFPVAILVSKIARADAFSKGNPLGEVVGYTHMSVILMSLPLVLVAFYRCPQFMVLIMAISFSLDFYLMSWAFGSLLFAVHATIRTVAVTAIWFAFPTLGAWLIPVAVAIAYGVTVVLSPMLRARWLHAQSREVVA
jgi:hypothetical protein